MTSNHLTLDQLEKLLGVSAHPKNTQTATHLSVQGLCTVDHPQKNHLVFVERRQKLGEAEAALRLATQVAAMLIDQTLANQLPELIFSKTTVLIVPHAKEHFIRLLEHFNPYKTAHKDLRPFAPTHTTSPQDSPLTLGSNFSLGPHCAHGKDVVLGDDVTLMGGNVLGNNVFIGPHVTLHPGVILYPGTRVGAYSVIHAGTVIGSDGFGYHPTPKGILKIPQIGSVLIGSRVEIGANVTIDRGTLGVTEIGDNVKIDNLVQIAHNVKIGAGSIIVAQVGIAGSSTLGRGVLLAGQVGIADHAVLGDGVRVGAQSGIMPKVQIPAGTTLMGSPALAYKEFFRRESFLNKMLKKRNR